VYFLGLIDILQKFNFAKWIERGIQKQKHKSSMFVGNASLRDRELSHSSTVTNSSSLPSLNRSLQSISATSSITESSKMESAFSEVTMSNLNTLNSIGSPSNSPYNSMNRKTSPYTSLDRITRLRSLRNASSKSTLKTPSLNPADPKTTEVSNDHHNVEISVEEPNRYGTTCFCLKLLLLTFFQCSLTIKNLYGKSHNMKQNKIKFLQGDKKKEVETLCLLSKEA
jgi:hypothetical protein